MDCQKPPGLPDHGRCNEPDLGNEDAYRFANFTSDRPIFIGDDRGPGKRDIS